MKETIKNLKKVYKRYGKEYKGSLIKIIFFSSLGFVTNIFVPLVSAKFIVNFTDNNYEQAIYMSIVILGLNLLDKLKTMYTRKSIQIFRRGTVRNIQMSLGREILKLDQTVIDANSSGTFIQRLNSDTDKMSGLFTHGLINLIRFLSSIGIFIAILFINYHMFLYYTFASLFLTFLNYIKNEKVGEKDKEYRRESDKVAGLTGELVRGVRDIKMLYAKDSFMKNLDLQIINQNEKIFEMREIDINYDLIIGYISSFLEFGTVLMLIMLINKNIIPIAIAIALYNYKSQVLTNIMGIASDLLERCKNFNISTNRIFAIMNNKEFKKEVFGDTSLKIVKGNFEFKNVKFGYNESLVLNNLSFKIPSGRTIGIVGPSGAGKTTIFNLLCRMYNVNSGKILIDGVDINTLDEKSIRSNITIISQNPYIFNMSIKDNFRLVKNNVTDSEIINACKAACLDEYIESLPDKYNTVVGEGGVNLSGGQRQRLAIARALVQNTKIILFDEATSALDNETQSKIQTAIDNLKGEYTILIIAHRLSTIINCDKIFILNDGKMIDSGTHQELLKSNKYYKQLCQTELAEK